MSMNTESTTILIIEANNNSYTIYDYGGGQVFDSLHPIYYYGGNMHYLYTGEDIIPTIPTIPSNVEAKNAA